jgi:hypothetical protein
MNENYRTARPVSKSFILFILFILSKQASGLVRDPLVFYLIFALP